MTDIFPHLDYKPKLPQRLDHGIGIVGAGGIVNYAHLPAYKKAGFKVVGITDRDRKKAESTAKEHGIERVYASVDELLRQSEIEIVDIAVYPAEQVAIVEKATAAGKHLLCQKPLADEYSKAVRSVELAEHAKVKIAVNQQMRWDAGVRCARLLMEDGWLGAATYGAIQVHCKTDWSLWPWIYQGKHVEIMFHSIHYIDSLRYLLSDVCHTTWHDDPYAIFRFEGTEGVIKGTIGLMYNYPTGRPDTLEFMSKRNPGYWFSARLDSMWIPDAFVGPMASLMRSVESGSEPETGGRDNLRTLQVVFAEYRSIAEKRSVRPEEISG